MKKVFSCLLITCIILSLSSCTSSDYKKAVSLYEKGEYDQARAAFVAIIEYKDAKDYLVAIDKEQYNQAVELYNEGKNMDALSLFRKVSAYKDSTQYITAITNPKGLIEEVCKEANSPNAQKYYRGYKELSSLDVAMYPNGFDTRYNEESRAFVCVKDSQVQWRLKNDSTWYYFEVFDGYIGHIEGNKAIIDKKVAIEGTNSKATGDEAKLDEFWGEYWK